MYSTTHEAPLLQGPPLYRDQSLNLLIVYSTTHEAYLLHNPSFPYSVLASGSEKMAWRARVVSTVARPRTLSRAPRTSGVPSGYTLANIYEAEVGNANFAGQWNENGNELEETQMTLQERFGELVAINDYGRTGRPRHTCLHSLVHQIVMQPQSGGTVWSH